MNDNPVLTPIVHVRTPINDKRVNTVINKYGNTFWLRQTMGAGVYLIPVRNGIPYVHDFIIVEASQIIEPTVEVGRGGTATALQAS